MIEGSGRKKKNKKEKRKVEDEEVRAKYGWKRRRGEKDERKL